MAATIADNSSWLWSMCSMAPWKREHQYRDVVIEANIITSYAYYIPETGDGTCAENLMFFDKHARVYPHMKRVLNLIGNTRRPYELTPGWIVRYRPNLGADVFAHHSTIREYSSADYYVLLNCGARGPFIDNWLAPFLAIFRNFRHTGVVGADVSHEISRHVQTHFVVVPRVIAQKYIGTIWDPARRLGGRQLLEQNMVVDTEIALSSTLIKEGWGVRAMCDKSIPQNPSFTISDPKECIFVKHGGEILRDVVNLKRHGRYDTCRTQIIEYAEDYKTTLPPYHITNICCPRILFTNQIHNVLDRTNIASFVESHSNHPHRVLLSISYVERPRSRDNLQFFIQMNRKYPIPANVVKVIHVADQTLSAFLQKNDNFGIIHRKNVGYDMGGHGVVMDLFLKAYKTLPFTKFLLMNAGVTGPILPKWFPNNVHWIDVFLNLPSKYVASTTTITCITSNNLCVTQRKTRPGPKINSFFFTVLTTEAMLRLRESGVFSLHADKVAAICNGEYKMSDVLLSLGEIKTMEMAYPDDMSWKTVKSCNKNKFSARGGGYFDMSLNPLEVLFHKKEWGTDVDVRERYVMLRETKAYMRWATLA